MPNFVVKQIEQTEEPTVELWLEQIDRCVYLRARRKGSPLEWTLLRLAEDGFFYRLGGLPGGGHPEDIGFTLDGTKVVVK